MATRQRPPERSRMQKIVGFFVGALSENWGTKLMAFSLALIVFVLTRDEVERSFTVPLRVVDDPDRVLLTKPPETVEVHLRGPWANVNRLGNAEIGVATLDLREARPGPMVLDPAAIVMPTGVVLDGLDYEPVDLRFEDVIERRLPVRVELRGSVDEDFRLTRAQVDPAGWLVRGPVSSVDAVTELHTEAVDIEGARADLSTSVALLPLGTPREGLPLGTAGSGLRYVGVPPGELPTVRVSAELEPIEGSTELDLEVGAALREALPDLGDLEVEREHLTIRGPRSALRELGELEAPVQPVVELGKARRGAPLTVTLRFDWTEAVEPGLRRQLSIEPPLVRLRLSAVGDLEPGNL